MAKTRSPLLAGLSARLHAQDLAADDGGLVRYAERLAKRVFGNRAKPMHHLAPLAASYEQVERAIRGEADPIFECHHAPVQHFKTFLIQAWFLRTIRRNPRAKLAYPSFSAERAEEKMADIRALAEGEGIRIQQGRDNKAKWYTEQGGFIKAGGLVGGPWTGEGYDGIVPDDPYKNAQEAESAAWRLRVESEFERSIWTRRAPHTSIVVNHARWHPNDLIGVLTRKGWIYKCLPAIWPDGTPLAPHVWPLEELLAIRDGRPATETRGRIDPVTARTWASLYQGQPRPDDGLIFDPAHLNFYTHLPDVGAWTEAAGVDLAYGAKSRHDRTAHVFFRRYAGDPRRLYLVEAWAGHEAVELYACRLAEAQIRRGGGPTLARPRTAAEIETMWRKQLEREEVKRARRPPTRWGTSTTEQGAAALMRGYGAHVAHEQAKVDLLARVQSSGYVAAWAEGRILYPASGGPHIDSMRVEHEDFTGSPSDADDTVAAANSGYELLHVAPAGLGGGAGRLLGERAYGGERVA